MKLILRILIVYGCFLLVLSKQCHKKHAYDLIVKNSKVDKRDPINNVKPFVQSKTKTSVRAYDLLPANARSVDHPPTNLSSKHITPGGKDPNVNSTKIIKEHTSVAEKDPPKYSKSAFAKRISQNKDNLSKSTQKTNVPAKRHKRSITFSIVFIEIFGFKLF